MIKNSSHCLYPGDVMNILVFTPDKNGRMQPTSHCVTVEHHQTTTGTLVQINHAPDEDSVNLTYYFDPAK